jgi:hypothetical protein
MDKLNKTYGTGSVLTRSQTTGDYMMISTGVLVLITRTLGVGGFVKGKMYELMGWEGLVNPLYVDMPLQNVKKQVELFFIALARILLIKKYFQELVWCKNYYLNHLVEEGFNMLGP